MQVQIKTHPYIQHFLNILVQYLGLHKYCTSIWFFDILTSNTVAVSHINRHLCFWLNISFRHLLQRQTRRYAWMVSGSITHTSPFIYLILRVCWSGGCCMSGQKHNSLSLCILHAFVHEYICTEYILHILYLVYCFCCCTICTWIYLTNFKVKSVCCLFLIFETIFLFIWKLKAESNWKWV